MLIAILGLTIPGLAASTADGLTPDPSPTVIDIRRSGGFDQETLSLIDELVWLQRGRSTVVDRLTLRLWKVSRSGEIVQQAPDGFGYPLLVGAVNSAAPILDPTVAAALERGEAVMGEITAAIRGAQVGDEIDLEPVGGGSQSLRIGAIVPDERLSWSEVWVSKETATGLGLDRPFSVIVWADQILPLTESLRAALRDPAIRVITDTDPLLSDPVLPFALVKQRFGEFAIRPADGDEVEIEQSWIDRSIVTVDLPAVGLFQCHRMVVPYVRAALAEVDRSGLTSMLDPTDFQLAGGCFNPRFNRGGDPGFSLSRHAWGIAVDFNPSSNQYGSEPTMPAAIVDIFRGWGFSWGGTWAVPDGMHFEWQTLPTAFPTSCAHLSLAPLTTEGFWYLRPAHVACS
jgi:hypothetical protein